MMDNINLNDWDEARYLELNSYFRVRIQVLIESDPYIKELVQAGKEMQLDDLINQLSVEDQALWEEFMKLDTIKLYHDMRNHLEGKGTPYNPRDGFASSGPEEDEEDYPSTW